MFENQDAAFGSDSQIDALTKAMQAGQITGRETNGLKLTVEPLKLESLEPMLKNLEFRTKDIVLWNRVPKQDAYNTVEEAVQLVSYGVDRGGFIDEGERPSFEDSIYTRISQVAKYIAIGGEVTLQAQLVKTMLPTSAYAKEIENKMHWVLRRTNTALTKADSTIVRQEFNGFFKQHAHIGPSQDYVYSSFENYYNSDTVYDLRGKTLTQYDIEQASILVNQNYGEVTDFFAPPSVITGLTQDYFKDQRILLNGNAAVTGVMGTVAKAITTSFGDVNLNGDKFMSHDKAKYVSDVATSSSAPAAPVADGTTPVALATDALAKFAAGTGETGTVFYAVSAINKNGESNLTVMGSTKVTITVGSAVDVKFTAGVGANAATGFVIYRTKPTAATTTALLNFYPLFKVSPADLTNGYQGSSAGLIRDRGYFMPDTEQGFITEMSEEVLAFKQLAPMSKVDLARTGLSSPFAVFLFGTPFLYAPRKMVRFINCGKTYIRPS